MERRLKYVRLKEYDEIIIFPEIINHSDFKNFNPVSAGFCYVNSDNVECFGASVSLRLASNLEMDSLVATRQLFGLDAMLKQAKNKKEKS